MCFVEPIVCLFAICYSNMYLYLLFTKIILLSEHYFFDKIFVKLFLQHNSYPEVLYFFKKVNINIATYCGKSCLMFKAFQFQMKHENIKTW